MDKWYHMSPWKGLCLVWQTFMYNNYIRLSYNQASEETWWIRLEKIQQRKQTLKRGERNGHLHEDMVLFKAVDKRYWDTMRYWCMVWSASVFNAILCFKSGQSLNWTFQNWKERSQFRSWTVNYYYLSLIIAETTQRSDVSSVQYITLHYQGMMHGMFLETSIKRSNFR